MRSKCRRNADEHPRADVGVRQRDRLRRVVADAAAQRTNSMPIGRCAIIAMPSWPAPLGSWNGGCLARAIARCRASRHQPGAQGAAGLS